MSLYKFRYYNSNFQEWDEFYTSWKPKLVNAKCPHCASHPLMIRNLYQVLSGHCQRYQCPACEEVIDIKETLFASHDDLSVVEMKEATTQPLAVADDGEVILPAVTPQPRNVRYTPEFIEKATKAMRDTTLKRQNIHVHEDDMESTCPACGYMLYEEANMIFNYCPTCGQALNNNDFSEDD